VSNTFLYRGRLHAVLKGEIYIYVGESVVDRIAALSWRVRVGAPNDGWARCLSDQYIASLEESLQEVMRLHHGATCAY
jgi:hypothetical protein